MRRKFSEQEVKRMRQLYRAGFSTGTIAKALGTDDREAIRYHVSQDGKGDLVSFVRGLLPHLPIEGPPFPRDYTLGWVELKRLCAGEESDANEGRDYLP